MYTVKSISPNYGPGDTVVELGKKVSIGAACEVLRDYLLEVNTNRMLNDAAPAVIRQAAVNNVNGNKKLTFKILPCGTVLINGVYPEMDYFTITKGA